MRGKKGKPKIICPKKYKTEKIAYHIESYKAKLFVKWKVRKKKSVPPIGMAIVNWVDFVFIIKVHNYIVSV